LFLIYILTALWTATASSRPGQSRIRFNAANTTHAASLQGVYSQLARTGEEPEAITDLDLERLVGTQDTGMESSI